MVLPIQVVEYSAGTDSVEYSTSIIDKRPDDGIFRQYGVDGFSAMAERSKRAGRIRPAHRLAMMRSTDRRFGALARDRFNINS